MGPKQLNDNDVFPFGKYRESVTKMEDVPATYIDFIMSLPWIKEWPGVVKYVQDNRKALDAELEDEVKQPGGLGD